MFTPRHPSTRPNLADVRAAEAALDIEGLMNEALAGRERIRVKP